MLSIDTLKTDDATCWITILVLHFFPQFVLELLVECPDIQAPWQPNRILNTLINHVNFDSFSDCLLNLGFSYLTFNLDMLILIGVWAWQLQGMLYLQLEVWLIFVFWVIQIWTIHIVFWFFFWKIEQSSDGMHMATWTKIIFIVSLCSAIEFEFFQVDSTRVVITSSCWWRLDHYSNVRL